MDLKREIKFRVWHKLIKKMINVYVLDQTVYWDENGAKRIKNNSRGWSDANTQITFTLDEVNLMQYTGLKDKNNVEIYEGDIITYLHETYKVKWDEGLAAFNISSKVFQYTAFMAKHAEIIGNIYENPELLEGDKK